MVARNQGKQAIGPAASWCKVSVDDENVLELDDSVPEN